MGQGSSPTAPQYDSSLTRQTGADQIANTISGAQQLVPVLGNLDRSQAGLNDRFNLRRMVAPGETFYAKEFGPANKTLTALKGAATRVKNGQTQYRVGNNWISSDAYQTRLSNAQTKVTEIQNRPITELTGAFADQFAARDKLLGSMDSAQASSPEYLRMQDAYGQGTTARTAGTAQASAAGIGQVADVRAQQVGSGALGDRLMGEALRRVDLNGRLSAQDERDVSQATRSGMAARGMATGSAGLGAELLNRDRFSRQRAFQDLGFASGVQEQDIGRQFNNVGNVLRADQGNQQTQFGREQVISGNQQQANLANMQAANNMSQFNAGQLTDADRYNMGLIGTSAQMADAEQARRLGLQQNVYNFGLQSDPRMMLSGMGSPLSNMTGLGAQLANVNLSPMYSGGQFSSAGGSNAMAGAAGGALSGAAAGAVLGPWGTAGGAVVGGLSGYLGSQ